MIGNHANLQPAAGALAMNVWIAIFSDVVVAVATIVLAVWAARMGAIPRVRGVALATAAVCVLLAASHIGLLVYFPAWFVPMGGLPSQVFVAALLTCLYVALHCLIGRNWAQTPEFRVTAIWNGIAWAISIAYLLAGTVSPWATPVGLPVFVALIALVVLGQVRGLRKLKQTPCNSAV